MNTELKTLHEFKDEVSKEWGYQSWFATPDDTDTEHQILEDAAERYAQHRYEEGLKADRQIDRDQLDILFHNYFDCYADDGDYGLPAMTFNRFIETVEKIMKSPPTTS